MFSAYELFRSCVALEASRCPLVETHQFFPPGGMYTALFEPSPTQLQVALGTKALQSLKNTPQFSEEIK